MIGGRREEVVGGRGVERGMRSIATLGGGYGSFNLPAPGLAPLSRRREVKEVECLLRTLLEHSLDSLA